MSHAQSPFSPPPRSDAVERAASTIAFACFLAAWVVAYVTVMPADPARHGIRLDASHQFVADGRVRP